MQKWAFTQIDPCLARGKFDPKLYTDPHWDAEEKYDGDRRIGQFCDGLVRFTGRRKSVTDGLLVEKTDNIPHLSRVPPAALLGTVLDGEIICTAPGARSKDVTSIMGSAPDVAVQKQTERGWLEWRVFDCLFFKGRDVRGLPLEDRRKWLADALGIWRNPCAKQAEVAKEDREGFLASIWRRGGEGIILKDTRAIYGREKSWVKVKHTFTEDVVIMGYDLPEQFSKKVSGEVSETKLWKLGWIGAVRFGQYRDGELVYCGSCSGMDDTIRKYITENQAKCLGRVVEILANEREPTGAFRHPRWVDFRDDKNPQDCLWIGEEKQRARKKARGDVRLSGADGAADR